MAKKYLGNGLTVHETKFGVMISKSNAPLVQLTTEVVNSIKEFNDEHKNS